MDLTNEDVADILALLDSLPYDSLDVETPRFRLTLRRAGDGGWTEESRALADPDPITPAPDGPPPSPANPPVTTATTDTAGTAGTAGEMATTRTAGTTGRARTSGTTSTAGTAGETGAIAGPRGTAAAGVVGTATPGSGSDAGAGDVAADGLAAVAAPLPGTFYRAPRPGAESFVQVGDLVSTDTVVAIIETMKLMNSVHAGTAGRVARICAGNGEFTPQGTTLMLIEPNA